MSQISELKGMIEALKQSSDELKSQSAAAGSKAEEVSGVLQSVGAEGRVAAIQQCRERLENAAAALGPVDQALEEAINAANEAEQG